CSGGRNLGVRAHHYITVAEALRARAAAGAGRGAIDARPGGVSRAASERHGGAPTPRGGPAARAARERDVPHLCALSTPARARRLAELRLRACCERSPASALDSGAREAVLSDQKSCERALHDLLGLDAMVARVHCDFVDILRRYDCDQPYSVHTCHECQG
ncbi:hypothetical protein HW555_004175, partial [Spodoptera exigua]